MLGEMSSGEQAGSGLWTILRSPGSRTGGKPAEGSAHRSNAIRVVLLEAHLSCCQENGSLRGARVESGKQVGACCPGERD